MSNPRIALIAFTTIFLTYGLAFAAQTEEQKHVAALASEGQRLTKSLAEKLEKRLIESPTDLDIRIRLVAYHWFRQYNSAKTLEHALWIIEHRPESPITEGAYCVPNRISNPLAYDKAAELWQLHAKESGTNIAILSHAANFFRLFEHEKAESYLERCRRLDPDSAEWPQRLGNLYLRTGSDKALAAFESALSKEEGGGRYFMLADVAEAALAAGDLEKAERYATELLDASVERRPGWNYGNAVHHGNLVLGQVALQKGDVERAELHLRRAGHTPGSPQLGSFGPSMKLALELLDKNRKKAVIEYLKLCGKFWNKLQTDAWIRAIEKGVTPDFGRNLDY